MQKVFAPELEPEQLEPELLLEDEKVRLKRKPQPSHTAVNLLTGPRVLSWVVTASVPEKGGAREDISSELGALESWRSRRGRAGQKSGRLMGDSG